MSHSSYARMWASCQGALEDLLVDEFPPAVAALPRPQRDRGQIFQSLATSYVKYLQIYRCLEDVYAHVVHPQKRRVVRCVLDGAMGRLLELKNEMVELELSEFHFFDDILQDLKLTPGDLEIPIPRWYLRERTQVLRDRETMLSHILVKGGLVEQEPVSSVRTMCLEEAVRILQVCERARQGRLRAKFMTEIQQAAREALVGTMSCRTPSATMTHAQAATRIQKVWLGYRQRRRTKTERLEELIFLGMAPAEDQRGPSSAELKAQQADASRRLVQDRNEAEYQRALVNIKESVRVVDGPDMKETLQEQMRQWFIECRDATGKFPDFPNTEDGGSASIFAQKTPEQVAAELLIREDEREKKKKSQAKKDKKAGKGDEKKKKGKSKGKKGKEDVEEEKEKGWKMTPSRFLPTVMEGSKIYKDVWQGRDDSQNFLQRFDAQLVREEKREEVEDEVRVQVDELMRQELKNLKLVVDRDRGKKKKKPKKGIKKKKKKKSKKTSKRKKKKEKDLTADRSLESLYEELVLEGILIRPMNIKLSDYIGEYNYLGTTLRQAGIEPMPSLSDVRQLVALYAILPLGSRCIHEKAPLVKSLLLAGPSGVGKKMLVHAICTETGANLFNLSPGNLVGKFPGRSGLHYLLHMVFKVARQLQPSVIWIGDAEKTFYKKVPKTEKEMEPKRLKKDLAKVLKGLKPEDRVLLVGTSRRPFDADLKPFCKVYRKILLIPRPDYASRLVLWRELLHSSGGGDGGQALDLSSLAKVTDGYTPGHILRAVHWVLSPRRLSQLPSRALCASEFIPPLARQDPVFKEEEEAFKMWYSRTPLGRRKARAAKAIEEAAELKKGKDGKSKGMSKTNVKKKKKKNIKSKK